jgi:hypothetical protein
MMELLKRFEEENSAVDDFFRTDDEDEEQLSELAQRLEGIDLGECSSVRGLLVLRIHE